MENADLTFVSSVARSRKHTRVLPSKGGNTSNMLIHLMSQHSIKTEEWHVFDSQHRQGSFNDNALTVQVICVECQRTVTVLGVKGLHPFTRVKQDVFGRQ